MTMLERLRTDLERLSGLIVGPLKIVLGLYYRS